MSDLRNPERMDAEQANTARIRLRSKIAALWRHALGILALSGFDAILFYIEDHSYWLRVLLSLFGLSASVLWASINFPPRNFRYEEGGRIAVENRMIRPWFEALVSACLNFAVGIGLAGAWCYVIGKYVATAALTSVASFVTFGLGLLLFACTLPIYRKALEAECSLLLECDHILRRAKLTAKERVHEIICPQCGEPYYAYEPGLTRDMCGQCYSHDRFVAEWWMSIFAFGILVSSMALRQLAYHLVEPAWMKLALWIIFSVISTLFWWPLVPWRRLAGAAY
jgi:uncharacterized protein (DUF983 family)